MMDIRLRSIRRALAVVGVGLAVTGCADDAPSSATIPVTQTAAPSSAPANSDPSTTLVGEDPATTERRAGFDFEVVADIVEQFVADEGLNGAGLVIVDRDAGIVGEVYAGEFDADRVSFIASSTKMLTAGVLLRLQDQGLVSLDTPIGELVPWAGDHPDITLAQMLSNSSGLVGLLPDPGYGPYVCQFIGAEMEACATEVLSSDADDADVVPPDSEFRYGGVQWQVAGAVAETVTGRTWAELIEETYGQPCGVDSLAYNNHWVVLGSGFDYPQGFDPAALAPTENPHMEGGAYIDPVDYATLLLMHLRDGECPNGAVLSPEAVAEAHADRIGEVWGGSAGPDTGYGLGWWVDRASGRISDSGAYGSVPWLDLGNGFGAYLVIEADAPTGNRLASLLYDPVEAAVLAGRAE